MATDMSCIQQRGEGGVREMNNRIKLIEEKDERKKKKKKKKRERERESLWRSGWRKLTAIPGVWRGGVGQ